MKRFLFLISLLALMVSGCRFIVSEDTDEDTVSIMPDLESIESIHLSDTWYGLSPTSPQIADVTLYPTDGGFSGEIDFTAGILGKSVDVFISNEDMQAFLDSLAKSSFVAGDYEPKIEWTDDYPSFMIEIRTSDSTLAFYSSSQGEGNVPWGMTFEGTEFVVDSDQPARALSIIQPDLQYDVFETLIDEAWNP